MGACGATSKDWLREGVRIIAHVEEEEGADYEYVALCWFGDTQESIDANLKERMQQLAGEGWKEYIRASWIAQHESGVPGGACIMRRPKEEPRTWTEKELRKMMRNEYDLGLIPVVDSDELD